MATKAGTSKAQEQKQPKPGEIWESKDQFRSEIVTVTNEAVFYMCDYPGSKRFPEALDKNTFLAHYKFSPPEREMWLNIYPASAPSSHATKQLADAWATQYRIACIKVKYHEGQFD